MQEKYDDLKLEIIAFESEDVITTSDNNDVAVVGGSSDFMQVEGNNGASVN